MHSAVAISVTDTLKIGTSATTITVDAGDLLENDSNFHTDVDRGMMEKIPMESASSGLSSLVTETSPGVASDSNGQMHGLGDHASNTFSIDGQDISDQQSKVFFKPASVKFGANLAPRSDLRRATGGVRRQDQPHHPGDNAFWTGA